MYTLYTDKQEIFENQINARKNIQINARKNINIL